MEKQSLEVFCKKGVLKNFAKFTEKHLCQSLFFNKNAGATCNFIKKETLTQMFPVNFAKFLRTPFYRTPLDNCFGVCLIYISYSDQNQF